MTPSGAVTAISAGVLLMARLFARRRPLGAADVDSTSARVRIMEDSIFN
jgi:hypothetical protein